MFADFVSIVVPTFRRPVALGETLDALIKLDYAPDAFEIIVVDDGSNDETPQIVNTFKSKFDNLTYLPQSNSGVATARNNGARAARGDILIFNDDDIIVAPDLIERHLRHLREFGACLVNGHWEFTPKMTADLENSAFGQFRMQNENWVKDGIGQKPLRGSCVEPTGVTACNLGLRAADFWRIGGFDEDFPHAGCEDQEFSARAATMGYKFVYDYELKLWHNDHRLNLQQFGERQRRGAITKVLMAVKSPAEAAHPIIVENSSVKTGEGWRMTMKKISKKLLSNPVSLNLLLSAVNFLERRQSSPKLLNRLYKMTCGLYIFRGVRQGIKLYGEPRTDRDEAAIIKEYAKS